MNCNENEERSACSKSGYSAKFRRHSDIDGYRMFEDVSEVFGTDATWCNNNNQDQLDDHSKDDIQMFILTLHDFAVCFCKT